MPPSSVVVTRTSAGVYSLQNSLNAVPEGALLEAKNVSIDRDGVTSKRRGFDRYGQLLPRHAEKLSEFKNRLIMHDGEEIRYNSSLGFGAVFTAWAGSFEAPDPGAATRMHFAELKENLYFTEETGIWKNDELDTDPVRAGMPPGLDMQLVLTGTGGGMFEPDTQVAYRIVWGRVDRNFALILGAPSTREVIANPVTQDLAWARSGAGPYTVTVTHTAHGYSSSDLIEISEGNAQINGTRAITKINDDTYTFTVTPDPGASGTLTAGKKFNITITFTIPDGIQPDDFYEVYRTKFGAPITGGTNPEPGDRCLKLKRTVVQLADIDNKKVLTFTDNFDPIFLEEDLYTNAEVEGLEQANTEPPWAKDICAYNGSLYFANTMREQAIELRLLTTQGIVENVDSITIASDDIADQTYEAFGTESAPDGNGFIGGRQFKNFESDASVPLESQKVEKTIKSLIRVINRDVANTKFYAFYVSEIDKAPGSIQIERRTRNSPTFYIVANNSTFAAKWTPGLATGGTSLASDNNRGKNLLFWSKFDQPEAVPETNFEPVGSEEYEILRILAVKGSLFIFKEDGVWRASGPPGERPDIEQLDPTIILAAPEAACVGDGAAWCLATQGVVRVTETGTEVMSRQIEDRLKASIFQTANYEFTVQAAFYESAREFLLVAPGEGGPEGNSPTTVWAYNYFTGPNGLTGNWCRKYERNVRAIHVLSPSRVDKLYIAHDIERRILEERKSTIGIAGSVEDDYQDEMLTDEGATVTLVDTTTNEFGDDASIVTISGWSYYLKPEEGWMFTQNGVETKIVSVFDAGSGGIYTLTLSAFEPLYDEGPAVLTIGIPSRVRWVPEEAETVALMKRWQEVHVYLQSETTDTAMTFRLGFRSDIRSETGAQSEYFVRKIRQRFFEDYPYAVLRVCPLPYQVQRSRAIGFVLEHKYAKEPWNILNVAYKYVPLSSRVSVSTK